MLDEETNHTSDWIETEDEEQARQLIFETQDILAEVIAVPEWAMQVKVIAMTGEERARVMQACTNMKTGEVDISKAYPDVVILCAHHVKTGKRIFKPTDRAALLKKAGSALDRIAMKALSLSGMTEEAHQLLTKN